MKAADLADLYRLSPVQQEMLSHALARPGDDLDVVQLCVALSGPLALPALHRAWGLTGNRHAVLCTSFRAGNLPSQLVARRVVLPFAVEERSGEDEIASFLAEDRARGFDPARGPLARLTILRAAPGEHLLVWTYQRLILDSRSAALVASQVLSGSGGQRQEGGEPERSRAFRDYVVWLRGRDGAEAERFWRRELAGLSPQARLGSAEPRPGRTGSAERTIHLEPSVTAALEALAREQGLALATLAAGAWALLLSRRCGRHDVLFGIAVAGRPAALPGAQTAVGRFANTLPLRVEVEPEASLLSWLRRLEERRAAAWPFEHTPPLQAAEWSGMAPGAPLFHSRLAVESFPALGDVLPSGLDVRRIAAFPEELAVVVRPGAEIALQVVYDRARFDETEVAAIQEELRALLEGFAADPLRRPAEIPAAAAPRELRAAEGAHRLDRIAELVPRRVSPLGERQEPLFSGYGRREPPLVSKERQEPPAAVRASGGHQIVPVPRDRPIPATFYQEWGLQLDGVERNSIPNAFRMAGELDLTALRRSLTEIVRRHESLRTSFRREGGEAYLATAPPAEVPLPLVDLAELPETRRADLLPRLVAGHADRAFDLARGPLFLAQALRLGPREHVLLLNTHHLISDGWSTQVLQRELMILYSAFRQGQPSPLPPLPVQLADFAHWQRRVFAGEALAAQIAWWRRTLANLPPPPELPTDLPRPAVLGPRPVDAAFELPPGPTWSLVTLAQAAQCSLPMVLLAAVDALLHAYSGQEDLVVSVIFAARNRPEISGLIGLFMNTVPLRVDLSGDPSFRTLVERVREATLEAYSHQDVPFPRLLEELFPGRRITRTLLSGVVFNMLGFDPAPAAPADGLTLAGGLNLQPLAAREEKEVKVDLFFNCAGSGGSARFDLMGAADLFTPERLEALARDFESLLLQVATDHEVPLGRLRRMVRGAMGAPALR